MLTSCKSCAAVNVLDIEHAATGKARCMICRKRIELPDDHEDETESDEARQSFRVSANHPAAILDPADLVHEIMEQDLTPLMPLYRVKQMLDVSCGVVPDLPLPRWDDVTSPDPLDLYASVPPASTTEEPPIEVEVVIDTDEIKDREIDDALFLDSKDLEDDQSREIGFAIVEPARHSENLPMVFDVEESQHVATVPSIPAAKRHKMSSFAAIAAILALGSVDLLASRSSQHPASMAAARGGEPELVQLTSAPPQPSQEELAQLDLSAEETDAVPVIDVENLPVTVVQPARTQQHHAKTARPVPLTTEGEALSVAADIAFQKQDYASARTTYARALASNPSYFPARLGAADVAWAAGDRAAAREAYRALTENYPRQMLPSRVWERKVAIR